MPYISKRTGPDSSKTSPLKMVGPIIRKYEGHRQKWNKISRFKEVGELTKSSKVKQVKPIKAILPKGGEIVCVEPELLGSVSPDTNSTITTNDVSKEISLPVQEICAIARLVSEEYKNNVGKRTTRQPRRRAVSNSVLAKKKQESLELLKAEPQNVISAREDVYAANYFRRVKSVVGGRDEATFNRFCTMLEELETGHRTAVELYTELKVLFAPFPDLIEEFLPFLTLDQAQDCGVFMEYLMLTKMADFVALIDTYFAKTPYQIRKIYAALENLSLKENVGVQEVTSTILPHLKGNAVLTDYFLQLLPDARPPDAFLSDFDDVDDEALSDGLEDDDEKWERIELPPMEDFFGGDKCPCTCHDVDEELFQTRTSHCLSCSKRFINGRLCIPMGKALRPATVVFSDHDYEYHKQRLVPYTTDGRKRKRSGSHGSPTKASAHSHSEEEDEDRKKRSVRTPKSRTPKSLPRRSLYTDRDGDSPRAAKCLRLDEGKPKRGVKKILIDAHSSDRPFTDSNAMASSLLSPHSQIVSSVEDPEKLSIGPEGGIFDDAVTFIVEDTAEQIIDIPVNCIEKPYAASAPETAAFTSNEPATTVVSSPSKTVQSLSESLKLSKDSVTFILPDASEQIIEIVSSNKPPGGQNATSESVSFTSSALSVPESGLSFTESLKKSKDSVTFILPDASEQIIEIVSSGNPSGDSIVPSESASFTGVKPETTASQCVLSFSESLKLSKDSLTFSMPGAREEMIEIKSPVDLREGQVVPATANFIPFKEISEQLESQRAFRNPTHGSESTNSIQTTICPSPELLKNEENGQMEINVSSAEVDLKLVNNPILIVVPPPSQIDPTNETKKSPVSPSSPPVLSIPENSSISPAINPLLTVIEGSSVDVKQEIEYPDDEPSKSIKLEMIAEDAPWKLEEDRVILHTLQNEKYCEETFVKISEQIPVRSVEHIKKRFQELLTILYKMKSEPSD